MRAGTEAVETIQIESRRGWPALELGELWRHRGVVFLLMVRDTKVRYKQSLVGIGWAVLQPLLTMAVFTVLFDRLVKLPGSGAPYPLVALCALVPWTYFSHALTKGTISLVEGAALMTKVYFPRLAFPLAAVLAGLMDFAIAFALLLAVLTGYGVRPRVALLALPLFLLLAVGAALAVSLWLAAVNVQYRDVTNALPFAMQVMLFASPVAYATELVPERWRLLYAVNPMATVIDGFRWCLLGEQYAPGAGALVSVATVLVVLAGGLVFFRFQEERFADVV